MPAYYVDDAEAYLKAGGATDDDNSLYFREKQEETKKAVKAFRDKEQTVLAGFKDNQNEVREAPSNEAAIRAAVLENRKQLREGGTKRKIDQTKKRPVKVARVVQVASPKKAAEKEKAEPEVDEAEEPAGGGLLGLGDYGSDGDD